MSNTANRSSGIGFCGLLTIVFITLKLLNAIQWSWIWVFSPLWISAGIRLTFFIVFLILWILANSTRRF